VVAHPWWSLRERDVRLPTRGLSQMVSTARSKKDPKPTRKGIALNLDQWVRMRKIAEAINNDHPVLAAAIPCYLQEDH